MSRDSRSARAGILVAAIILWAAPALAVNTLFSARILARTPPYTQGNPTFGPSIPTAYGGLSSAQGGIHPYPYPAAYGRPTFLNVTGGGATITVPHNALALYQSYLSLTGITGWLVFNAIGSAMQGGAVGPGTGPATLKTGYLPASVPITANANQTAYPNAGTVRSGFVRLIPGSQGFGGPIGGTNNFQYFGLYFASPTGYYQLTQTRQGVDGAVSGIGFGTRIVGMGTGTHTMSPTNTAMKSSITVATGVPWATGSATAFNNRGYGITSTWHRGAADNRNAAGTSGTISVVTASISFSYNKFGGVPTGMNNGSSFASQMNIKLLPEPGGTLLLGSGVLGLGLIALHRRRRH